MSTSDPIPSLQGSHSRRNGSYQDLGPPEPVQYPQGGSQPTGSGLWTSWDSQLRELRQVLRRKDPQGSLANPGGNRVLAQRVKLVSRYLSHLIPIVISQGCFCYRPTPLLFETPPRLSSYQTVSSARLKPSDRYSSLAGLLLWSTSSLTMLVPFSCR